MRMTPSITEGPRRRVLTLAATIVLVSVMSACTGPPASVPPAPAKRSPGLAGSPVVADAPPPSCEAYLAYANDPEVRAVLEKTALWPEVIAEAEQAVAGASVDRWHAQQLHDALAKGARPLRDSEIAATNPETAQLASHALGLSARLAEALSDPGLDRTATGEALAELKQAIAAYEEQVSDEERRCRAPDGEATPARGS